MLMRTQMTAHRIAFAGAFWLQASVFAAPGSLLMSYPRTYAVWRANGDDGDWTARLVVVALVSTLAIFNWSNPYLRRLIRMTAHVMQAGAFLASGLMFGSTHPPQIGICYLAFAPYCAWLAWVAWCAEL